MNGFTPVGSTSILRAAPGGIRRYTAYGTGSSRGPYWKTKKAAPHRVRLVRRVPVTSTYPILLTWASIPSLTVWVSSYGMTPSGFDFKIGAAGQLIDPCDFKPVCWSTSGVRPSAVTGRFRAMRSNRRGPAPDPYV